MFKKFLALISILMFSGISFAGELEDAAKLDKTIFLYMYTSNCGFCRHFAPRFHKLSIMYDKKFTFVKIDANTQYGYQLMRNFGANYVPYVLLINPKNSYAKNISADCLKELVCVEKAMKSFN